MFTGRDALSTVEQAIGRVRFDESRLDGALRSAIEEAGRHRSAEAEGFRLLARIRLDTMMSERVVGHLDATERRALALIDNHRRAIDALAHRRDGAQAALTQAEASKHERDGELAAALDAVEQQRARTAERIKPQPEWIAAKAAITAAQEIAQNAEEKAKAAEADLGAKRKPYEDDPLFMYLWGRKHGRADDNSSYFVRFFDRKVARLVGYQDARANYAMLLEIPARLREHANNKTADVKAANDSLAALERQALVADGIEALEARAVAAQEAVNAAAAAVEKITADLKQIDGEREKAAGAGEDAAYGGAVELLAQALAREDLRQLYNEALRTPTTKDEQAVESIRRARHDAARADGEVGQIRGQIREMAGRRNELEGARDRARRGGYDNPRGTFDVAGGVIIGEVIGEILKGAMRGRDFDRTLRDHYRDPPRRDDSDFGRDSGSSWPGPSIDWGGGSWGGDSGDSGGGGGGDGGWTTGGEF